LFSLSKSARQEEFARTRVAVGRAFLAFDEYVDARLATFRERTARAADLLEDVTRVRFIPRAQVEPSARCTPESAA
jgi:hypothetical protein